MVLYCVQYNTQIWDSSDMDKKYSHVGDDRNSAK